MTMFKQSFKMAIKAVASNKVRSFLTMLGIIIGVMSLVVLVSLVDGATSSVSSNLDSMGSTVLTVTIVDDKSSPLTESDLADLVASGDEIADVAQYTSAMATLRVGSDSEVMMVYGISSNYFDVTGDEIVSGRDFLSYEVSNSTYGIVIDENTSLSLFGKNNAEGETLYVDNYVFTVIGTVASDNSYMTSAYIPITTLERIGLAVNEITTFYVEPVNTTDFTDATTQVEDYLLSRLSYDEDAYSIMDVSSMLDAINEINNTMLYLLAGIASISLIVGGIGIMNIMLVSVTERTKEIGIRKAIGAKNGSILSQFLIEALVLSLMGGVIGLVLSYFIIMLAATFVSSLAMYISIPVSIAALAFSVLVGVVFGIYPAHKAANKTPIEALRYAS